MTTQSIWRPFSEFPIEKCMEFVRSGKIRPDFRIVVRTDFYLVPHVIEDYWIETSPYSEEKLCAGDECGDELDVNEKYIKSWAYLDDFLNLLNV